jgi:hypothetical protein
MTKKLFHNQSFPTHNLAFKIRKKMSCLKANILYQDCSNLFCCNSALHIYHGMFACFCGTDDEFWNSMEGFQYIMNRFMIALAGVILLVGIYNI